MTKTRERGAGETGGGLPRSSDRWTRERAQELLSEASASGLSLSAFAKARDVDVRRLYAWNRRLRESSASAVGAEVGHRESAPLLSLCLLGGCAESSPGLGQQLINAAHGPAGAELAQDVDEIAVGLDALHPAGGEDRVGDGGALGADVGSSKEPVAAPDGNLRVILLMSHFARRSTTRGIPRAERRSQFFIVRSGPGTKFLFV